ncbi:MAG: hypothetical protein HY331_17955 [Chloroflexi bacterium]|nr:hypothetical protein [Chloroflexota bacterium]
MASLGKILKDIGELMSPSQPTADPAQVGQQRDQALFEMKMAVKRMKRDVDRREEELEARRERAKELIRRGREDRAREEAKIYKLEENVLARLRTIYVGQEQAYSVARAMNDIHGFTQAGQIFDRMRQIDAAGQSLPSFERQMQSMLDELDHLSEAYGSAGDLERRRDRSDPVVEGFMEGLKDEVDSEREAPRERRERRPEEAAADAGKTKAFSPEERLRSIQEDRTGLRRTRGEPS